MEALLYRSMVVGRERMARYVTQDLSCYSYWEGARKQCEDSINGMKKKTHKNDKNKGTYRSGKRGGGPTV